MAKKAKEKAKPKKQKTKPSKKTAALTAREINIREGRVPVKKAGGGMAMKKKKGYAKGGAVMKKKKGYARGGAARRR